MSNFIKLLLITGFILSCSYTHAQVPGYRGKRVILKVNVKGMPFAGFLLSDEKPFDFNLRFSSGFDVVLSKRISAGLSIEQVNDIINLKKYAQSDNSYSVASYNSAANFYGYSYGGNVKFFSHKSSGSLAPFGRFIVLEFQHNRIDVTDDGRFYSSGKSDLNNIRTNTLLVGIGSQKIIFDRFLIEGNIKVGFNSYGLMNLKHYDEKLNYDEVTRVSTSKMFSDFLINVGLGIGFLAF